ncbi:MAG: glycolate oxidase subunit GlcE [Ectothiorhodospiraceae bacterium]|nr:glycolate oxidase subunit GlcE [Ectothiorhodospiraceae bacterium]
MTTPHDTSESLANQILDAYNTDSALCIVGGNSKASLGQPVNATSLDVSGHCGIVEYEPTELVVTARAGTSLTELESIVAEAGQTLPFEPPHLGAGATLGGTIACGLSGPRRPHSGSARDYVLGVKMINGRGEILQFGGQVMKNVAGYDVSRLQVGAQGTLGVLLDVSLKVLPRPACERTVFIEMSAGVSIEIMSWLAAKPLPLSAACHVPEGDDQTELLCLRLSGAEAAVDASIVYLRKEQSDFAIEVLGENDERAALFWQDLRERKLGFFSSEMPESSQGLWRLSLPPATPVFWCENSEGTKIEHHQQSRDEAFTAECLIDWAGAQRWMKTNAPAEAVHEVAKRYGGYATLLTAEGAIQSPLSSGLMAVHKNLKHAFDPKGILNSGRLYAEY